MLVRCHHDPREFFELVEPFLLAREAENALPLGIARSYVQTATHDGLMFSVESGADVVAVAVKSPKRSLITTAAPDCAMRALAAYLDAYALPVPGITGPADAARAFCHAWCALTGARAQDRMRLRLFALSSDGLSSGGPSSGAQPSSGRFSASPEPSSSPTGAANVRPRDVAGTFRLADDADGETVERWLHAFVDEATHERHDDVKVRVQQMIGSRCVGLWDDDGPASMASITRRSDHGAHLSWVYTPPERRGHGYASACVAELSRRELTGGRAFCTLYSNQANATSNAMYERLGYQPISDAVDAVFVEA